MRDIDFRPLSERSDRDFFSFFGWRPEREIFPPKLPAGWRCENGHLDPDTGAEFVNDGRRETCEICTRPRPVQS
jgi:hypothetical protein